MALHRKVTFKECDIVSIVIVITGQEDLRCFERCVRQDEPCHDADSFVGGHLRQPCCDKIMTSRCAHFNHIRRDGRSAHHDNTFV